MHLAAFENLLLKTIFIFLIAFLAAQLQFPLLSFNPLPHYYLLYCK